LARAVDANWNFRCSPGFTPQIELNAGNAGIDVAEKNKEITDVIGRRLREAADAERTGQLPESIQAGLERLSGLGPRLIGTEPIAAGRSSRRPGPQPRFA
jgi:hypothetical protein